MQNKWKGVFWEIVVTTLILVAVFSILYNM